MRGKKTWYIYIYTQRVLYKMQVLYCKDKKTPPETQFRLWSREHLFRGAIRKFLYGKYTSIRGTHCIQYIHNTNCVALVEPWICIPMVPLWYTGPADDSIVGRAREGGKEI